MSLKNFFSKKLFEFAEKRGYFDTRGFISDYLGGQVRFNTSYFTDERILESSDVYELLQDISNQIMLAEIIVEDKDGNEITNHSSLKVLKNPNGYLTGSEFIKLMTNIYLLYGEVYPILDGNEIHIARNVYTELDETLQPKYMIDGVEIPSFMIRHIKNIGTNHLHGMGILELGKEILGGVINAENLLTSKYTKGGLLAFLLKLDAHINPKNGSQSMLIDAIINQLEAIDSSRSVKIIPLGQGYEIEPMTSPIDDSSILSYLDVYKKDLGKYLNINVDTYTSLIKSDLEKAMMYLHNKAVKPIMKNFEDHLSLLFFGANSNKRIKFKINILDFVPYSTKTNIGYNIVRTGITSPDNIAEMLGFPKQNTEETQAIYISNDLSRIGQDNATDDSLKGGEGTNESGNQERQHSN